jgi:hypothetical protein
LTDLVALTACRQPRDPRMALLFSFAWHRGAFKPPALLRGRQRGRCKARVGSQLQHGTEADCM